MAVGRRVYVRDLGGLVTGWEFALVIGVLLGGLGLLAFILSITVSSVARAIGAVGRDLLNPQPRDKADRQDVAASETTDVTEPGPPWEKWPEPPVSRPIEVVPDEEA